MAVGKQIGEFTTKITSVTYGAQSAQLNTDGTATGFGRIQGTVTVDVSEPGATRGTCSAIISAYLDDGSILGGNMQGTWENSGKHQWRVRGVNSTTDGRTLAVEGEIDLATDSFNGTLYEWS